MLHLRWLLAATLFAAPVLADDPATPIIPPDTGAAKTDPAAAVAELTAEYNKTTQEFFKPWREARARKEQYKLDYSQHPRKNYAPRFQVLAVKYAGTDAAIDAWLMVLSTGGNRDEALSTLMRDHIKSAKMSNVVRHLTRGPKGGERMAKLIEETPHRDVKGFALLIHGESLLRKGDQRAERVLSVVAEKYGDVSIYGGRMTAGQKATGDLFEVRNLTTGKTAPDIEGEDIDGVAFKLSDYRGKVVLLDFWGDW